MVVHVSRRRWNQSRYRGTWSTIGDTALTIHRSRRPQSKYGSVNKTGSQSVSFWPGDGGPNSTLASNSFDVNFPVSFEYFMSMSYVNLRTESRFFRSQPSGRNKSYQPFVLYDYTTEAQTQKINFIKINYFRLSTEYDDLDGNSFQSKLPLLQLLLSSSHV